MVNEYDRGFFNRLEIDLQVQQSPHEKKDQSL